MHEPDAVLELRFLVLFGRLERPLEVVEDREQLPEQRLVGAGGHRLVVARGALAEVVELRLQPLERVEVVVALLLELGDIGRNQRDRPLLGGVCPCCDLRVGHQVVGASSSTTSASSITSSSEGASPFPLAAACCAVADA